MTDYSEKYVFLGDFGEHFLILPFSGRIVQEEKIDIEKGLLAASFPLNVVSSSNKVVLIDSSGYEFFINNIDPVAIYLSPSITLPFIITSISVYALYRKWLNLVRHLLKYKIFYSLVSVAIILFLYSEAVLGPEDAMIPIALSVFLAIIGLISIGTANNNFTKSETRLFWKTIISTMLLESIILPLFFFSRVASLPFSSTFYLFIFLVLCIVFISCCAIGMVTNASLSILAGFFLLLGRAFMRIWTRLKSKNKLPPINIAPDLKNSPEIPKYFAYCVSQLFIISI